jgi:Protein of unknown function (DUF1552)
MSSEPKVIKVGRRHFLVGVGGFALAIPYLSSLERVARAGGPTVPPRYFYLGTDHGGCWDSSFFPQMTATQMTTVPGVSGHTVTAGPLALTVTGSTGSVGGSQVLTASSATLTNTLVGKMNVLRGLDVPWYMAHNTGLLGNFARNDGNGSDGVAVAALGGRPTIDQVMASSPTFYTMANLAITKATSVIINGGTQPHSYALTTPGNPTGGVTPVSNNLSSLALFQSIFGASNAPARKPVVDLVNANYKSLVQSNTRLSSADATRLNQHMQMLSNLETELTATLACARPSTPMDNSTYGRYGSAPNAAKWGQLFVDVIALAFACNASRVGVFGFGDTSGFSPGFATSGQTDWHQDVAHKWYIDQPQGWLLESYQAVFEQVFLYLAAKLDGMMDAEGGTVLDNSLIVWGQECSMETHAQTGIQTVSFGGGAGTLNTGLYCDYRQNGQTTNRSQFSPYNDAGGAAAGASTSIASYVTYPGLLWEQWLATQLLAMGVPTTEWELWQDSMGSTQHGYGTPFVGADQNYGSNYAPHYLPDTPTWTTGASPPANASPYFANASSPLPFLMK